MQNDSRIRLVLAIPTFDLIGGAETHVEQLAQELSTRGCIDVRVLCVDFGKDSMRRMKQEVDVTRLPIHDPTVDWLAYNLGYTLEKHSDSKGRLHRPFCQISFSLRTFFSYLQALKTHHPDVVDIHGSTFTLAAVAYLLRLQYVVTIHTTALARRLLGPFGFAYRHLLTHAVFCVAIGSRIALDLEAADIPADHIRVVRTAISSGPLSASDQVLDRRRELKPHGADILLYYGGRFVESKGIDSAIRAVAQLRDSGMVVGLVCAGRGPELENLKHLAAELGVDDRVTFAGALIGEDLRITMEACDIGVFPSRGDEGLPRALLEFMAHSKPVIVSNQGDMADVARGSGVVLEKADPSDICRAVEFVASSRNRTELGRMAAERIKSEFSIERIVPQLVLLYQSAVRTGQEDIAVG